MSNAAAILVGSDPEVFVTTPDGKGPGSAIGLVGGTKTAPRPVEKGALQEDNVLAEFNIDPAASEDEFVGNLTTVLTILSQQLPKGVGVLLNVASHEYDEAYLHEQGEQAMVFGCDPDMDAFRLQDNMPPRSGTSLRTAGGHIHIGCGEPDSAESLQCIIRNMDVALGLPSVIMDSDVRRRELYGKASCCRPKPYGVEYRTLSNFWLRDEATMRWAYRQTQLAAQAHARRELLHPELDWEQVREVINTSDKAMAIAMLNSVGAGEYVCQ